MTELERVKAFNDAIERAYALAQQAEKAGGNGNGNESRATVLAQLSQSYSNVAQAIATWQTIPD